MFFRTSNRMIFTIYSNPVCCQSWKTRQKKNLKNDDCVKESPTIRNPKFPGDCTPHNSTLIFNSSTAGSRSQFADLRPSKKKELGAGIERKSQHITSKKLDLSFWVAEIFKEKAKHISSINRHLEPRFLSFFCLVRLFKGLNVQINYFINEFLPISLSLQ